VPHRIFSSLIYPLQAPNGSNVVIYGHEQGIRIIWRGGRSFRAEQTPRGKPKINGSSKDDAMVLDSDDDEPAPDGVSSTTDFEVDEVENDSSEPYQKIIRYIDIQCGTCVRHVTAPYLPAHLRDSPPGAFPPIVLSNIVVAAACNDNSIRLVTLPLLPPLPFVDGNSYKAVQIVIIAGINTHHEVPSSITITHSAVSDASDGQRESSKSRSRSRNHLAEDENASTISHQSGTPWCFLLVSTSATAGGLLLTHQIPVVSDTQLSTSTADLPPIQRCSVNFPCLNSKLVFNPSEFPADRHSTVLVSAADSGCVKVYQVSPDSRSRLSRGRRSSIASTDSAVSGLRTPSRGAISKGRFLITLYPGFIRSSTLSGVQRRQRILDVAWVACGRAIIVLLEDGEWGVWDLEGAGPGSGPANLLRGQSNMSGIQGGSLTKFALKGRLTPAAEALPKTQQTEFRETKDSKLAPMTPHTRKVRSEGLFKGGRQSFAFEGDHAQRPKGQICVTEHAPSTISALSTAEESLLIAYDSNIIYVSSLQALWRAETSSKGTIDSVGDVRPSHVPCPALGRERLISVAELPNCAQPNHKPPFGTRSTELPDLLVVADHRLALFVSPQTEPISTEGTGTRFALGLGKNQEPAIRTVRDQALLRQGQLDLEGMDRVLEGLGQEEGTMNGQGGAFTKSVAFDLDDDMDMSMTSPTPKAAGRSKRTPGRLIGKTRLGAFS
jgi:hypothetical protein